MTALLDSAALDDMLALLGEEFRDIARQYVTQLQEEVARLLAARAAQDWMLLARHAHALKGSSGNMGARALAERAAALEAAARSGDAAAVDAVLQGLSTLAHDTAAALRAGRYV